MESSNTNNSDTAEKKKSGKIAIIICCILLVIVITLLAAVVILLLKKEQVPETNNGIYVMDENNYSQIKEQMEEEVSDGYFETYMNTEWTFADGTSETTDAILGNSPNNTKPIRCEVLLVDGGEKIFSTGVLPVGVQLPAFKLDVDLDAGVYDAVCRVYLLNDMGDGTYSDYSSAGFNITITVQN